MSVRLSLLLLCLATPSSAQDFGSAAAPHTRDALRLLEDGLPGEASWSIGSTTTRWWGLPELTTRAIAAHAPMRAGRVALGLSQSGDEALGWTSAALAIGAVGERSGGALRAVFRRDRTLSSAATGAWGAGRGAEWGAGAWLQPADGVEVWASAPQLATRGIAPPLRRALVCGVRLRSEDIALWATLSGPRREAEAGARAVGASLSSGHAELWAEARDEPWRGIGGVSAGFGDLTLSCSIETHPRLDETVRLSLSWSAR